MLESPEIAGLLYKRRGGFGKIMPNAWQYRFFTVSKEGVLYYFDTEVPDVELLENKARGKLELKSIVYEVNTEPIEGAPTNFAIQIAIPNEEKWKLCADTKEDQTRWIKVLEKFNLEKPPKPAPRGSVYVAGYASDEDAENKKKSIEQIKPKPVTITPLTQDKKNPTTPPLPSPVSNQSSNSNLTSSKVDIPQTNQTTNNTVHKSAHKKHLKLASKKSFIEQETAELAFVILIINLSIFGICSSTCLYFKIFYSLVINAVVYQTLTLRFQRYLKKENALSAAQASQATELPISTSIAKEVSVAVKETNIEKSKEVVSEALVQRDPHKKPLPGSTLPQVLMEPRLAPAHSWAKADHRQFNVRVGPNYDRYKKKAPSGPPLFEAFAVDVFCAKNRIDHAASRFEKLDTSDIDTHNPHVPPIFVIQLQIPSEPPASFFSNSEDGPGWSVVMYYRITEDTCNQLKDLSTASPAVKLFAEWCEKAPTDPAWRGRFKVINSCTNLDELGFPSLIVSYNAKPVLIRRTGTIFRGPNYMEMDIHVHKFANVAKQSIYLISSRCGLMYMQIGFVIEGRDDKELPETLFACVAVNKPQEEQAEFLFDEVEDI